MNDRAELTQALTTTISILQTDEFPFGPPTTDYDILMRACYGPLLVVNATTGRRELIAKRLRPAGSLEQARSLTSQVVRILGGEQGATVQDVQAALDNLTESSRC